jgi:hypothetical protein
MKISLLALASAVAAVPHYGAHSKFHNSMKPSGSSGAGKPYPSGGWGGYNSTRVAQPTGDSGEDKTIDVTSTSTTTLLKTVVVRPSPAPSSDNKAVVEKVTSAGADQCGPATVTVTASEKVTITVTPGGGADVPKSSAVVSVKSEGNGYGAPSSYVVVTPTPNGDKPSSAPVVVKTSSKVEEAQTTKAPEVPTSKAPEAPTSKPVQYPVSSAAAEKPASSAVVPSVVVSSAAPSETPTSGSGNTYSGSKRGLAYNQAHLCKAFGANFGFAYSWAQVENNDVGAPFVPMMHRPTESTAEAWLANVDKAAKKGSKAVMGFNEPDIAAQANLSPAAACAAWKEYMNPIAASHPEMTIIGPSVSNSGSTGQGLSWLSSFHEVCPDAVVHATNLHFYDIYESATIDRFKAHIEKGAAVYGKPVWVTEFGLNPGSASQTQAASFLKEAMAYLDASDKVQGYSWFMVGDGENQLNVGTELSEVGKVYAAY